MYNNYRMEEETTMKKFKKITVALMCLCLAVSLVPMALADDIETSGTCGDNLT